MVHQYRFLSCCIVDNNACTSSEWIQTQLYEVLNSAETQSILSFRWPQLKMLYALQDQDHDKTFLVEQTTWNLMSKGELSDAIEFVKMILCRYLHLHFLIPDIQRCNVYSWVKGSLFNTKNEVWPLTFLLLEKQIE